MQLEEDELTLLLLWAGAFESWGYDIDPFCVSLVVPLNCSIRFASSDPIIRTATLHELAFRYALMRSGAIWRIVDCGFSLLSARKRWFLSPSHACLASRRRI